MADLRRRIFDAFRQGRRTAAPEPEWVPLAEAALTLRRAQAGTDLDRISQGLSDNEDSLLVFWAHRVWQIGVPVWGCRVMAAKLEIVPAETLRTGRIYDGATRLDIGGGEPTQDFCALQVRRRDLEDRLAGLDPNAVPDGA